MKEKEYISSDKSPSPELLPVSKKRKVVSIVFCVLFCIYAFLGVAITAASHWVSTIYDDVSLEQIIINLLMPTDGVDPGIVLSGIKGIGIPALISLIIGCAIYIPLTMICAKGLIVSAKLPVKDAKTGTKSIKKVPIKAINDRWYYRTARVSCWVIITAILSEGIIFAYKNYHIKEYIDSKYVSSDFIENNYVDPFDDVLEFPEKKKNLIYIFMESTESTLTSKENGGAFDDDVIPELTMMMKDKNYTSFSNTDTLGGAISTYGATWTMGAMFAQSSGLPLKLIPDFRNGMTNSKTFFNNTACLGDILEKEGYNQAIIMGSDGEFGGRTKYYTVHGNQRIYDLYTAEEDGIIENLDEYVQNYWGLFDKELYSYAKKVLGDLSSESEPFALTLLTVDTHFSNGYPCELCANFKTDKEGKYLIKDSSLFGRTGKSYILQSLKYNKIQYSNVYSCASKQVYEFVEWLKEQDFYDNTTIVIAGDHLTMDTNYVNKYIPDDFVRTPLNVIINSEVSTDNIKQRQFATLDMYPTTLAAMGVKIKGDRLGLGTNLFSDKKTLIEEYGLEYFETEINKKSDFYNNMEDYVKRHSD